jgi:hypothetical protein
MGRRGVTRQRRPGLNEHSPTAITSGNVGDGRDLDQISVLVLIGRRSTHAAGLAADQFSRSCVSPNPLCRRSVSEQGMPVTPNLLGTAAAFPGRCGATPPEEAWVPERHCVLGGSGAFRCPSHHTASAWSVTQVLHRLKPRRLSAVTCCPRFCR